MLLIDDLLAAQRQSITFSFAATSAARRRPPPRKRSPTVPGIINSTEDSTHRLRKQVGGRRRNDTGHRHLDRPANNRLTRRPAFEIPEEEQGNDRDNTGSVKTGLTFSENDI